MKKQMILTILLAVFQMNGDSAFGLRLQSTAEVRLASNDILVAMIAGLQSGSYIRLKSFFGEDVPRPAIAYEPSGKTKNVFIRVPMTNAPNGNLIWEYVIKSKTLSSGQVVQYSIIRPANLSAIESAFSEINLNSSLCVQSSVQLGVGYTPGVVRLVNGTADGFDWQKASIAKIKNPRLLNNSQGRGDFYSVSDMTQIPVCE